MAFDLPGWRVGLVLIEKKWVLFIQELVPALASILSFHELMSTVSLRAGLVSFHMSTAYSLLKKTGMCDCRTLDFRAQTEANIGFRDC